jgi:hypothetical protein
MRGVKLFCRKAAIAALVAALASAATNPAIAGGPAYGAVGSPADLDRIFAAIRAEVVRAQTRADLTRLYRRASYLVTLTYARAWRSKFGAELPVMRADAERQFSDTVAAINQRAAKIGTDPDYVDHRGDP